MLRYVKRARMPHAQPREKDQSQRGQIIVEAALALPLYLIFSLAMLQLVVYSVAQARVEVAVNSAARELSQFAYATGGSVGSISQDAVDLYGSFMEVLTGTNPGFGSDTDALAQLMQNGDEAAQLLLRGRLEGSNDTLRSLGVVDGANGLRVNPDSTITDGDKIVLIVDYQLRIPFVDYNINMSARAETARWEYPEG